MFPFPTGRAIADFDLARNGETVEIATSKPMAPGTERLRDIVRGARFSQRVCCVAPDAHGQFDRRDQRHASRARRDSPTITSSCCRPSPTRP